MGPVWDLADHPNLQNLAVASGFCEAGFLEVGLVKQVEEDGIRWPAPESAAPDAAWQRPPDQGRCWGWRTPRR